MIVDDSNSYSLLVSIVPHDSGDFIVEAARKAGASGGSIVMGRGTASNSVLQLLGFGDSSKDIVYIIVNKKDENNIFESIKSAAQEKKNHFGVIFSVDVGLFMRSGNIQPVAAKEIIRGENNMENSYQMINIIVNKGYAEDAMAAARKAGANGGTIIGARGTAKEDDAKFFGMKIVPEKDMLMILAPEDKKDDIINAITSLPCFAEAGSGIIFCNRADKFTLLGKK